MLGKNMTWRCLEAQSEQGRLDQRFEGVDKETDGGTCELAIGDPD
jgi:hypothetical protein